MVKPTGTDDHRKRIRLKWLKRRWRRVRSRPGPFGDEPMPMSHKDLWVKIKKETKGKSPVEELRILTDYLSDWPEFKGPYQELRKKLERRVTELRKVKSVLSTHGGSIDPFSVRKRGLAEVVLVGLPNSGKSTVMRALTGVEVEVADYPYTTLTPNVAMFSLGGFEFEIIDLPPFPEGPLEEVHFASGLKEAVLNAGLVCLVIDLRGDIELEIDALMDHLRGIGADPAVAPGPGATDGRDAGGATVKGDDHAEGRGVVVAATHADQVEAGEIERIEALLPDVSVFAHPLGDGDLRLVGEALCELLGRIVVDARDPATKEEPYAYAVRAGATVLDLAEEIHKDLAARATRGRVWGRSAKFPGQEVGLDHVLAAGDTVEILMR